MVSTFEWLRVLHIGCALCSISGFALRGYWMLSGNALLQHRAARVLPHLIDTLLLGSAIAMLVIWQASPLQLDWLMAKIVALLVYIGLGMVALRFGRTKTAKTSAWVMALLTAVYMLSVAYSKNPWGYFAVLAGQG